MSSFLDVYRFALLRCHQSLELFLLSKRLICDKKILVNLVKEYKGSGINWSKTNKYPFRWQILKITICVEDKQSFILLDSELKYYYFSVVLLVHIKIYGWYLKYNYCEKAIFIKCHYMYYMANVLYLPYVSYCVLLYIMHCIYLMYYILLCRVLYHICFMYYKKFIWLRNLVKTFLKDLCNHLSPGSSTIILFCRTYFQPLM